MTRTLKILNLKQILYLHVSRINSEKTSAHNNKQVSDNKQIVIMKGKPF